MSATPDKYGTIAQLREAIVSNSQMPASYVEKMIHKVPALPTVKDRAAYLVAKTKDKVVLDIGCTGPISRQIREGAKTYFGVDSAPGDWAVVDIDHRPDMIPLYEAVEVIVLSEVLEHLANPGYFLKALKALYKETPAYITVPNAGAYSVKDDCEIVNSQHVCWYSYTTMKELLRRYKYEIKEARWYNGQPHKAEGLIFVV